MNTDKELNQIFAAAPTELYTLLNLPAPRAARARSESFKVLETSTDLVVEPQPLENSTPVLITEFQGYRDKQFLPKLMVRCGLFRVQHPHQAVRCHAIYLDREFESAAVDDGGMFQPQVHYLPDLIRQLEQTHPNSPILSVLHPLTAATEVELTSTVAADYDNLRTTTELDPEQRAAWLNVFHFWLMKRLKKTIVEIQNMLITNFPEVEELPWGQELKAMWTAEGRVEGQVEGQVEGRLNELREQAARYDELHATGDLSDTAHGRLKVVVSQQIEQLEAELRRLQKKN